ncbi:MAG: PilX N-terminal domain-containing pilus assembly protein [Desulfurivibrionaceae bacterium]
MKNTRESGLRSLNQKGIALISSLLLLVVLSLMAIGLSMDSSMNVRIAGYQRLKARSFGYAESGLLASADLLEDNIYESGWDASGGDLGYPNLNTGLYTGTVKIKQGFGAFYMENNPGDCGEGETTMEMRGDIEADIASQRLIAKLATGGAIQVAAGYAGVGKSLGAGGAHVLYNIRATGIEKNSTRSELAMHYRVVTK